MTFRLTLKTAPTVEPLTTAEARLHLRITTSYDDTYIGTLITAARQYTESVLKRALINQTWNYYLDAFASVIELPRPPLSSVSSIKYTDTDGVEQTLSTAVYTVDTDSLPGRVYLAYNQTWPDIREQEKAVDIEYVGGYGAAASAVPTPIKQAMLLLIGHLYEHRESVSDFQVHDVPVGYEALLYPYRMTYL